MNKRIVIGCDGTWNKPDQIDRGKRRPSNVVKLLRAVLPEDERGIPQVTFYDQGLGTHWGLTKWVEGFTGYGISTNILDAYEFLCLNYQSGDEVYLFGFSRGAFTVRSLVGLISKVGILPKKNLFFMPEAYEFYRQQADATQFCNEQQCVSASIRFLGVFDTVGALGIPISALSFLTARRHRFHDVRLSPIVEHAYQALAIDEKRKAFEPSLWQSDEPIPHERMQQVWYAGVHSNIGGGYDPDGLSNLPLHSIKKRAAALGLAFDNKFLAHYRPNASGDLRDSVQGIFRLGATEARSIGRARNGNETVHPSVYARIGQKALQYEPGNVPPLDAD